MSSLRTETQGLYPRLTEGRDSSVEDDEGPLTDSTLGFITRTGESTGVTPMVECMVSNDMSLSKDVPKHLEVSYSVFVSSDRYLTLLTSI